MGYLSNFLVYVFAMAGVIMLALLAFKITSVGGSKASSKYLKVHDTLSLGPRKTLYIVSAGDEKFLIAGDVDKTTLISKLQSQTQIQNSEQEGTVFKTSFKETMEKLPHPTQYMDKSCVGIYSTNNKPYN